MEEPKPSGLVLTSLKTLWSLKAVFLKVDVFMVMPVAFSLLCVSLMFEETT